MPNVQDLELIRGTQWQKMSLKSNTDVLCCEISGGWCFPLGFHRLQARHHAAGVSSHRLSQQLPLKETLAGAIMGEDSERVAVV